MDKEKKGKGKLSKTNPARQQRDTTIAEMRLQGKSIREIAKEIGLDKSQVCRVLNDKEVKEILDKVHRFYGGFAEDVGREFMGLCLLSSDPAIREKAIKEYHKIMGISPAHTPSIFIQNLYQDNRQQIISSDVLTLLGKHLSDPRDTIDMEPLELDKMRPKENDPEDGG